MAKLALDSDTIGVVSTAHPSVAATIDKLSEKGIHVLALISQRTAKCRLGYVRLAAWKLGRTARWALDNSCRKHGKLGPI